MPPYFRVPVDTMLPPVVTDSPGWTSPVLYLIIGDLLGLLPCRPQPLIDNRIKFSGMG